MKRDSVPLRVLRVSVVQYFRPLKTGCDSNEKETQVTEEDAPDSPIPPLSPVRIVLNGNP